MAGAVTGGALTFMWAGPVKSLMGATLWATVAWCGQAGVDALADWRAAQAEVLLRGGEQPVVVAPPEVAQARDTTAGSEEQDEDQGEDQGEDQSWFQVRMKRQAGSSANPAPSTPTPSTPSTPTPPTPSATSFWPSWLPIKKLAPGEREAKLRKRLQEIDDLLADDAATAAAADAAGDSDATDATK